MDKSRYIYLYAQSAAQKKRYQQAAKKAGMSESKFLISMIEEGLNASPVVSGSSDVTKLQEENKALREQVQTLENERENWAVMLEEGQQILNSVIRNPRIDLELLKFLRDHDKVSESKIADSDFGAEISFQLEFLEKNKFISKIKGGYAWIRKN